LGANKTFLSNGKVLMDALSGTLKPFIFHFL
jgi:hypothetical protein